MTKYFNLTRRRFIKAGLIGTASIAAGVLSPSRSHALGFSRSQDMKEIAFHNLHTDERLRVTYWKSGAFDRQALEKINHILRDFRTGDIYPMAPNLMDLLHDLQAKLQTDVPIEIISGYRSPKTNAKLASSSDGVAKQSLHTRGLATDIRMHGISLRKLQTTALFMQRGGVGFYPKSDFVHVDVGRVRRWG